MTFTCAWYADHRRSMHWHWVLEVCGLRASLCSWCASLAWVVLEGCWALATCLTTVVTDIGRPLYNNSHGPRSCGIALLVQHWNVTSLGAMPGVNGFLNYVIRREHES